MDYEYEDIYEYQPQPHFSKTHILINDKKSIEDDIRNLGFDAKIANDASDYHDIELDGKTRRKRKRSRLIFYCVLHALSKNEIYMPPNIVAEKCNISKKEITKARNECIEIKTRDGSEIYIEQPGAYVDYYCDALGFNEQTSKSFRRFFDNISKDDSLEGLVNSFPQDVCLAIVYYFIRITNKEISLNDLARKFKVSERTISSLEEKIREIDMKS